MRKEREGEAICRGERRNHGGERRTRARAENEQCRAEKQTQEVENR